MQHKLDLSKYPCGCDHACIDIFGPCFDGEKGLQNGFRTEWKINHLKRSHDKIHIRNSLLYFFCESALSQLLLTAGNHCCNFCFFPFSPCDTFLKTRKSPVSNLVASDTDCWFTLCFLFESAICSSSSDDATTFYLLNVVVNWSHRFPQTGVLWPFFHIPCSCILPQCRGEVYLVATNPR